MPRFEADSACIHIMHASVYGNASHNVFRTRWMLRCIRQDIMASPVEPFFWRIASGQRRSSAVQSGDDDEQLAAFNYKLYELYGGSILSASELAGDELQTRSLPGLYAASRPASASRPPSPSVGRLEAASRVASRVDETPTTDAELAYELAKRRQHKQQLCMMQPMSNSASFKGHYQRPPTGFAQVSPMRKCTRRAPDDDGKLLAPSRAAAGAVARYAPAVPTEVIQRTEAPVALRRTPSSLALERLPRPRLMQGMQVLHHGQRRKAPMGDVNTIATSQHMSSNPKNVPIFSNQMYYLYFYSHTMQGVGALNFGRDAGNEVERLQGKATYWRLEKEADVRRAKADEVAKAATRLHHEETLLKQVLRAAVQTEEVTEEEARVAMAQRLARVAMAERLEVMEEMY